MKCGRVYLYLSSIEKGASVILLSNEHVRLGFVFWCCVWLRMDDIPVSESLREPFSPNKDAELGHTPEHLTTTLLPPGAH
jgi:hypothetical protein